MGGNGGGRAGASPTPETLAFRDKYQKATKYVDFREMLAKQRDLDAVIIATPDHMHATVAAAAMRAGKHVYCQKPLTFSVYESRLLKRLAKEKKVVTQMGNQGHSGDGTRRVVEWVRAGVIGPVREVHIYTDRPFWAQGFRADVGGDGAPRHSGRQRARREQRLARHCKPQSDHARVCGGICISRPLPRTFRIPGLSPVHVARAGRTSASASETWART